MVCRKLIQHRTRNVIPFAEPGRQNLQQRLVTIAPLVVLGPDILVWVLDALLQGRQVLPVLPVLVPEDVCVNAGSGDAYRDAAIADVLVNLVQLVFAVRSDGRSGTGERGFRGGRALHRCHTSTSLDCTSRGSSIAAVARSALLLARSLPMAIGNGESYSGQGDVIQHGDLLPESCFPRLISTGFCPRAGLLFWLKDSGRYLTGRRSGVLLHGAALGNKGVLAGLRGGAGEAALDQGGAQSAQDLALGEHCVGFAQ